MTIEEMDQVDQREVDRRVRNYRLQKYLGWAGFALVAAHLLYSGCGNYRANERPTIHIRLQASAERAPAFAGCRTPSLHRGQGRFRLSIPLCIPCGGTGRRDGA